MSAGASDRNAPASRTAYDPHAAASRDAHESAKRAAPRFALGIPARGDEVDLRGTLDSLVHSAVDAGGAFEVIVALNGPGQAAARAVAAFVRSSGGVSEGAVEAETPGAEPPHSAGGAPPLRVLSLPVRSKVAAWNAIRDAALAPVIVFADADVRVAPVTIARLLACLEATPKLALVGAREQASVAPGDGVVARVAALPYRFVFRNVPGRLYALRSAALPEPMPAHVLHEDAYLTVRLGHERFTKEPGALVYFRPPATWSEYLRDRVRNEVAKLQLAREFPHLLGAHGVSPYPWTDLLRALSPAEYPLLFMLAATRLYARVRARRLVRRGFPTSWSGLPSTKRWVGAARV